MIELLEAAAAEVPELPAVVDAGESITYAQLHAHAVRHSIEDRRRVIQVENGVEWARQFWSAMAGAATVVALSPRLRPAEAAELERAFLSGPEPPPGAAVVQFTAGSTGPPKGAMLSAEALALVAAGHARSWGLRPGDAVFVPNPASHVMGLVIGFLMPVLARTTLVTLGRFEPGAALGLIERHRTVAMAGAPTHYQMLTEHPDLGSRDVSSLRFGLAGGAASTPGQVRRVMERLGLAALLNGYGMSEASGSISRTALDDPVEAHALTCGRPVPWVETRLQAGELHVRGRAMMLGYLADPGPAFDEEGWFRTGDLFELDADGRLRFQGRLKDLIVVGGLKVQPAEVERALTACPGVAAAAVVGVPDDRLGEVPVAFVVAQAGSAIDAAELETRCRDVLSGYKVPRRVIALDALPLSPAGKVQKFKLRELART